MGESYKKFASYITELRMDHQDGKAKSDELDKLLVQHYIDYFQFI